MPHCVDTPYSAHTPRILDIVAVRFVDRENIRITGNHDVLMDRETNLARSLSVDRVWIHHMVKPATHAVAVLVLELDGEVPPVRTIGAHPEVTLGQTYALPLDHKIVLDFGDHVKAQALEH